MRARIIEMQELLMFVLRMVCRLHSRGEAESSKVVLIRLSRIWHVRSNERRQLVTFRHLLRKQQHHFHLQE
jgi:hypothetical protein